MLSWVAKFTERLARDVTRLNLGDVDRKRVADLLQTYYSYGLTDGQNDIVDQEKQIWEWSGGNIRLVEN